jgi:dephospho-CoA kinase
MVILGITGGIGSGKSYVSSLLREQLNVPVYDCDTEAKRLICEDENIRQKLTELVGAQIYLNGKLQKSVLADYLFASQQHAQKVNAIVHPVVKDDFCKWAELQSAEVISMESAILYESGFDTAVNKVLYINAPTELRIQRAMKRDGCTRRQVEARISLQQSESQLKKADFVIDNGVEGKEFLLKELQKVLEKITANEAERL